VRTRAIDFLALALPLTALLSCGGGSSGSGGRGGSSGGGGGATGGGGVAGAAGGAAGAAGGIAGAAGGAAGSGGGVAGGGGGVAGAAGGAGGGGGAAPFRVLVFSRTTGFPHDSIPDAIAALTDLGAANGYVVEATEDPTTFTVTNLARFQVVVFALTTGDPLNDAQQTAFEAWLAAGGNWVGIHSAADTEYAWPAYGTLVGAYFKQHPAIQQATVRIEVASHPATAGLPAAWVRTDEWYDFQTNPRATAGVTVLATIDESTYSGGTMGADHPIVWAHATAAGGRAIYTAMGHTKESYADPMFRQHLAGVIRWAAGR
jgi:type 1 glutamine amidotransferase